MGSPTAYSSDTFGVVPGVLYTLTGFIRTSGISKSRISAERFKGHELPTVKAGRRVYVRGEDGIAFIERIAAAERPDGIAASQDVVPEG